MEPVNKKYDLLERTAIFAERVRNYALRLPKNAANVEYIPQLIRAGSSPGSNYIEANEGLGDKDFKMKIKTSRKESKETAYWLRLTITDDLKEMENERQWLRNEAKELVLIFSGILKKRESGDQKKNQDAKNQEPNENQEPNKNQESRDK